MLWFFVPAIVANMAPGWGGALFPGLNRPISRQWLGTGKTWLAYPMGIGFAILTIYLQRMFEFPGVIDYRRGDLWLVGLLMGTGAILGDHVESFCKRMRGIPRGEPWWPWDVLDYVIGGLLLVSSVVWIGWSRALLLAGAILVFHYPVNAIGYLLGHRKRIL